MVSVKGAARRLRLSGHGKDGSGNLPFALSRTNASGIDPLEKQVIHELSQAPLLAEVLPLR